MMEAGRGRIVNVSSSSTHSGQPFMAHYVVVESAVNGLTKSLALEYGPSGVTVNALPPRFIDTPDRYSASTAAEHLTLPIDKEQTWLSASPTAIWAAGYRWPKKGPATPDLTTAQGRSSAERGVSTSPVTQPLPT
jgi:NAD(P)-dependent dehydrogenase (short-subunit alcohol dehydrogenase family)